MAANEDEIKLRLQAETFGYRKAWADVRVQTAKDLAQIKATVTTTLNQTRTQAAQSLAQTRVNTAQQLAQIRVNTAAQLNQIRQSAGRSLAAVGSQFEDAGRRMSVGLTLPLGALAAAAVRSAKSIDAQVNTLRAFTGSTEAAEKRLAQLIATANNTPGLTNRLALSLDAQLRPLKVAEETIDRILPALGRLNAVSTFEDPQKFARNLVQIVTQNFERTDLKELVGQSPLAGQLITEIFNVDSPINSEAIRKSAQRMGITTVDAFFVAFADAAARNKGLQNVTESIGTRFDKLADRVAFALRPLGLAIVNGLTPAVGAAVPVVEALGRAFAALPTPMQTGVVLLGGLAAALGPALFLVGALISSLKTLHAAYVTLNALALIPTISNLRLLAQVMAGTASLTAGAGATAGVAAGGWIALGAAVAALVGVLGFAIARYTEAGTAAETSGAKWARALLPILNPLAALTFRLGEGGEATDKLGQAQAGATRTARAFTGAIEAESESLKQLKRALQEAELAAKSRADAARRAFDEGLITSREQTATLIANARELERVETARLDAAIKERQERLQTLSLGPTAADPEEQKKILEEVIQLQFDKSKSTQEAINEIKNLESQQRIAERRAVQEHQETLLDVRRTFAQRQIEVVRGRMEQEEGYRLQGERTVISIERRLSTFEEAEIRRRLELFAAGTEERRRIEDELARFLAERGRQRAEQARRVARAEFEAALLPVRREGLREGARGAGDEGAIARLRDEAERGAAGIAQTEQRIGNIVDEGFARRIKNLKDEIAVRAKHNQDVAQLNAELAALEQERVNASEDAARRVRDGGREDAERQRQNLDRLLPLERAVTAARVATRKALHDATRFLFGREQEFITERYAIEREQIELAHKEALSDLNDREHEELLHARRTLGNDEAFNARRLEIQRLYDELRKEQASQTNAALTENERQKQRDVELQDPNSTRSLFGDTFASALEQSRSHLYALATTAQEVFAQMSASAGNFTTILAGGLQTLVSGLGNMLENFLLVGTVGPAAFKKLAAGILAHYAATFAIKAVDNIAEGISNLAKAAAAAASFNPFSAVLFKFAAAQNFAAAAKYGLGAVATGVAAAALSAGGSGGAGRLADGGATGGATGSDRESERAKRERERAEEEKNWRREDRRGESTTANVTVPLIVDGRELGRALVRVIRDGGDLQDGFSRALRPA